MATHDTGTATVNSLSDAKPGDTIWLFESQMSLHDEDGKYRGRGVWRLYPIQSETRVSFVVSGQKFDRATGRARQRGGFQSSDFIAGEADKQDRLWLDENKHAFLRVLERADAPTLRKIAELIGWEPKP
jgi:hypothetical protein